MPEKNDKIDFDELIEFSNKENGLVYYGKYNYGEFYELAIDAIKFSRCIKNVDPKCYIFPHFFNHTINCFQLSILSTIRKHEVQAQMILRQALESSVLAAYSLYNQNLEDFGKIIVIKGQKNLIPVEKAKNKANKWLNDNYKNYSDYIKEHKDSINGKMSHANIEITETNIKINIGDTVFKLLQFDSDVSEYIFGELFSTSKILFNIIEMFYAINKDFNLITFVEDFEDRNLRYKEKLDYLLNNLMEIPIYRELYDKKNNTKQ